MTKTACVSVNLFVEADPNDPQAVAAAVDRALSGKSPPVGFSVLRTHPADTTPATIESFERLSAFSRVEVEKALPENIIRESANHAYQVYDFGEEFTVESAGQWDYEYPFGRVATISRTVQVSEAMDPDNKDVLTFKVEIDAITGDIVDANANDEAGNPVGEFRTSPFVEPAGPRM